MFGRRKETSWTKVVAAVAALKLMPMKKTLLGIAAVAGAAYAIKRLRASGRSKVMRAMLRRVISTSSPVSSRRVKLASDATIVSPSFVRRA